MADASLFPDLPGDAHCWIYVSDAPLDADMHAALLERVESFLAEWSSHDRPVRGDAAILHDRFLVLAATLDGPGDVSGCGIDASVHAIEDAAADLGVTWAPSLHVAFRADDGSVQTVSRSAFRARAEDGTVTTETIVFDPSVTTLAAVRNGDFEQPAGASWHARAFALPEPA
jgi:hypothetical protein